MLLLLLLFSGVVVVVVAVVVAAGARLSVEICVFGKGITPARARAMAVELEEEDEEEEERVLVWVVLAFAFFGFSEACRRICRWIASRLRPICWMQPIRLKGGGTASQKGQRLSQIMKDKT